MWVAQGDIPTRVPIVEEGFLEAYHTLQNSLLVSHMTLRIPLKDQDIHLIGRRKRGLPRKIYMENLGRSNLLLALGMYSGCMKHTPR